MRVLVQPADLGGCGNYRLIMAAEHLKSQGHDVILSWPQQGNNGMDVMFDDDNNLVDFRLPFEDVDVLVVQRVSHDLHVKVFPMIRERGIATVIDMDDNLGVINPRNSAFWNYRTGSRTPFSAQNAEKICRSATLVTVSTRNLLNVYAKHGRGQVIDNYVPERYLYVNGLRDQEPVFGWGGTFKSHPTDFQVVGRAVKELVDEGHRFRIVGPGEQQLLAQLHLKERPEITGSCEMLAWPTKLAGLDVGMAPLEASAFNTAKSRLKLLEYGSLGIPYVASPREEYRRFHKESGGPGFLVDTPKQWATHIRQLLTDDALRKELAEQGRMYAATQTIEKNSWRWLEAWQRAYEIQRSGK